MSKRSRDNSREEELRVESCENAGAATKDEQTGRQTWKGFTRKELVYLRND